MSRPVGRGRSQGKTNTDDGASLASTSLAVSLSMPYPPHISCKSTRPTKTGKEGGERSGGAGGTLVLFRQVALTNEILGQTEHELTIDRNIRSRLEWDTNRG